MKKITMADWHKARKLLDESSIIKTVPSSGGPDKLFSKLNGEWVEAFDDDGNPVHYLFLDE